MEQLDVVDASEVTIVQNVILLANMSVQDVHIRPRINSVAATPTLS
jgi:hypothetical protein